VVQATEQDYIARSRACADASISRAPTVFAFAADAFDRVRLK
jgi:hypothetical protein